MLVDEPDIIDDGIPTIKSEIVEIDDVVPSEPWLQPKTEEIIEIDNVVPTEPWPRPKTEEIIEIDDVVPTEPWLRPKTEEIIKIDDVVPTEPWLRPTAAISQETVKLPRPIPKTDLPKKIDHISAISDISGISNIGNIEKLPNQFDNVDGDIDFNIVKQTPDDDNDVIYIKYVPPPPEVPVQPPIHPRERLKQKMTKIRMKKERYRKNAKKKAIKCLNKKYS